MLYLIYGEDAPDSLAQRMTDRPAHLARLRILQEEGRLVLAGPCPAIDSTEPGPAGYTGSLIVAEFTSLEAAQNWAKMDPYRLSGVYTEVTVKPFKKVLPE
jgi:uncharacterized protein